MKIIDLLNKLANDEEMPKKIRYNDTIYYYDEKDDNELARYRSEDVFDKWLFDDCYLNDEVEIIEDEKKDNFTGWKMYQDGKEVCSMDCSVEEKKIPEKLEDRARFQYSQIPSWFREKELIDTINENFEKHQKAIYELIDYLKSKGDE